MKNPLSVLGHPVATVLAVAAIILAGTLLRAWNIDHLGIPGDELEVERICGMGSSWEILRGDVNGSINGFLPGMVKLVGEISGAGITRTTCWLRSKTVSRWSERSTTRRPS